MGVVEYPPPAGGEERGRGSEPADNEPLFVHNPPTRPCTRGPPYIAGSYVQLRCSLRWDDSYVNQSINQSCISRVVEVIKSLQDPLEAGNNLPGWSMTMSGNEASNRNVFKRWRKVDRDRAYITLSGRLFQMVGPATGKASRGGVRASGANQLISGRNPQNNNSPGKGTHTHTHMQVTVTATTKSTTNVNYHSVHTNGHTQEQ